MGSWSWSRERGSSRCVYTVCDISLASAVASELGRREKGVQVRRDYEGFSISRRLECEGGYDGQAEGFHFLVLWG